MSVLSPAPALAPASMAEGGQTQTDMAKSDQPAEPVGKRSSQLLSSLAQRLSPSNMFAGKRDSETPSQPHLSKARLSFHIHSPMFRTDDISPSFRISFPTSPPASDGHKPPALSFSVETALSNVTTLPAASQSHSTGQLSANFPVYNDLPTSRSTEVENAMIDQQLEMLGQLFPQQMKSYSQVVNVTDLESNLSHLSKTEALPSAPEGQSPLPDDTSDFQQSPVDLARLGSPDALVSWTQDASKDGRESHAIVAALNVDPLLGDEQAETSAELHEQVNDSKASPAGLIARRSLLPGLRVDTANSQQYATKELQLIRRMKEQGRLAAASKAASNHAATTSQSVSLPDKVSQTAAKRNNIGKPQGTVPELSGDVLDEARDTVSSALPVAAQKKLHRNSADSSRSGIVWSAVVERFSELAQEIAGNGSPFLVRQVPAQTSEAKEQLSGAIITTLNNDLGGDSLGHDANTVEDEETSTKQDEPLQIAPEPNLDEPNGMVNTDALTKLHDAIMLDSPMSEPTIPHEELNEKILPMASRRRSRSLPLVSAMKSGTERAGERESIVDNDEASKESKLKRTRTVRVQSHHVKVEGDYADFLKKAQNVKSVKEDNDGASAKSGRTDHSGKSGVENGLFRPGSMRSILTGKTIATVGDVSIRDLSRGARFRHPNPFFSQQHGYRKIKAPHQAGPGVLRRKGSKIVRLSVFEGKSPGAEAGKAAGAVKRNSDDGETLGAALNRLNEEKRQAVPSIGDLLFQNENAVPRARKLPLKSNTASPKQVLPNFDRPQASSSVGTTITAGALDRLNAMQGSGNAKAAYAATAFVPGARSQLPFMPVGQGLPRVPGTGQRSFALPAVPGLPPVPNMQNGFSVNGAQSSMGLMNPLTRSDFSATRSRFNLGNSRNQMHASGTSNVGVASSNLSVSSVRSASGRPKTGQSLQTDRSAVQPLSAKTPMSAGKENFLAMTPGSELSVKSNKSSDRNQLARTSVPAERMSKHTTSKSPSGVDQHRSRSTVRSLSAGPSSAPTTGLAAFKGQNEYNTGSSMPSEPAQYPFPNQGFSGRQSPGTNALPATVTPLRPPPQNLNARRPSQNLNARRPSQKLSVNTQAAAPDNGNGLQHSQYRQQYDSNSAALRNPNVVAQSYDSGLANHPSHFPGSQGPRSLPNEMYAPGAGPAGNNLPPSNFIPPRPLRNENVDNIGARIARPPSVPAVDNSPNMGKSKAAFSKIFGMGRNKARA